jgi:hypothetical protein
MSLEQDEDILTPYYPEDEEDDYPEDEEDLPTIEW